MGSESVEDVGRPSSAWTRRGVLAVVLVTAAVLRFTGLDWGLRHPHNVDERYFVRFAEDMVRGGSLDHGYYEYPGLLFNVFALVFWLVPHEPLGPTAYLLARAVIASFSLASVFLAYVLGKRAFSERAGLVAGAMLAVSHLEVSTAHMIRPDVALGTLGLLALWGMALVGERLRDDVRAGAFLGAAVALKFTGVLLVPSYLLRRLLAPGRRLPGLLWGTVAAGLTFVVASPYSVLHWREQLAGALFQARWHYEEQVQVVAGYGEVAATYGSMLLDGLGVPAAAMALAGMVVARRAWRNWLFLLAYPLVTVLVLSTAQVYRVRFMVPVLGVIAIFAGCAVDAAGRRWRLAGLVAAATVIGPQFVRTASYVRDVAERSTADMARDWVDARVPHGSRVAVTSEARVGLDTGRHEVVRLRVLDGETRWQAQGFDLVIATAKQARALEGRATPIESFRPRSPLAGPRISLLAPHPELAYVPISLVDAELQASGNADALDAVRDGDHATAWESGSGGASWLEVELPKPETLARIELTSGYRAGRRASLRLLASEGRQQEWRPVTTFPGRPGPALQLGDPQRRSHVLLFAPTRILAFRIEATTGGDTWRVGEIAAARWTLPD